MRMKADQQDNEHVTKTPVQSPSTVAAPLPKQHGRVNSILDMQHIHGNQFVQNLLASGAAHTNQKTVNVELQPHSAPAAILRTLAPIYKQDKTPFFDMNGNLNTFDTAPANAVMTGHQLGTIWQRFGEKGLAQTIHGLTLTRGIDFTASALSYTSTSLPHHPTCSSKAANVDSEIQDTVFSAAAATSQVSQRYAAQQPSQETGSSKIAESLSHSGAGQLLPKLIQNKVVKLTGEDLADVRLHTDESADRTARLLGARAFTIGRSIYFAAGEYNPSSREGLRLLTHELAHAIQHRGKVMPAVQNLPVSSPSDSEETTAEQFADAIVNPEANAMLPVLKRSASMPRIQRAVSFSRSNDSVTKNSMGVGEAAAGFQVRPNAFPLFQWTADVTINGNPGDPFANFEVGPLQLVRNFWHNVHWGTGADHTHRSVTLNTLPIRDATAAGNTWYHDPLAQTFGARGDTRNTGLNDSPQSTQHPWSNPVAGRAGNAGWFNYGVSFVSYISARDTTVGTGANAFTAIANLYWNTMLNGTFDTSNPVGSRVNFSGGTVNRSGVIEGGSAEFPSMHGGPIANNSVTVTDT